MKRLNYLHIIGLALLAAVGGSIALADSASAVNASGSLGGQAGTMGMCYNSSGSGVTCDNQYAYPRTLPYQTNYWTANNTGLRSIQTRFGSAPWSGSSVMYAYSVSRDFAWSGSTATGLDIMGVHFNSLSQISTTSSYACQSSYVAGFGGASATPISQNSTCSWKYLGYGSPPVAGDQLSVPIIRVTISTSATFASPATVSYIWNEYGTWGTNSGGYWPLGLQFPYSYDISRYQVGYASITWQTSDDPNAALLSSINDAIYNQNVIMQQGFNQITDAVRDTIGAINQGEQDRYDSEKDEEQQREEDAAGDAEGLVGSFDFNVPNPFGALFNWADSCAHIPVIAGWLGQFNSTICPVFPASVRNALTPIVSIFSTILLFTLVYKWLTNGGHFHG